MINTFIYMFTYGRDYKPHDNLRADISRKCTLFIFINHNQRANRDNAGKKTTQNLACHRKKTCWER